jgi:hypothetical protein
MRSFGLVISLALIPAVDVQAGDLPPLVSPAPQARPLNGGQPLVGRFTVLPAKHFSGMTAQAQATSGATIPLWSHIATTAGTHYTYQMVGHSPFVAQTNQTTDIRAVIIPIAFTFTSFGNTVFDPSQADHTCSPAGTAVALTKASPIFNAINGNIWSTSVGTGEYVDLFQRANYNTQTNPSGVNPNYHTNLTYSQAAKISINVTGGDVVAGTCGNIGLLDINNWDNYIQTTIFPALAAQSPQVGTPRMLPIFLLYNVVLFNGSESNCCILGYHSAFNDPSYANAFHTYSSVEFDTNRAFTGVMDISAMSHEIAEWMDDPSGTNPTPSWGNIGQVSGCQANLEVGDPLSGTLSQIYMASNGYTYHVQDLAFTSWFYRQKPSTGVNGWFSFLGTFITPSAPC